MPRLFSFPLGSTKHGKTGRCWQSLMVWSKEASEQSGKSISQSGSLAEKIQISSLKTRFQSTKSSPILQLRQFWRLEDSKTSLTLWRQGSQWLFILFQESRNSIQRWFAISIVPNIWSAWIKFVPRELLQCHQIQLLTRTWSVKLSEVSLTTKQFLRDASGCRLRAKLQEVFRQQH